MSDLVDFIDDENEFNESVANYYAFTNVGRSVEDAMKDSFIDFDYSQEASNYFLKHYDRKNEVMDMFKDCEIRLRISKALSPIWNFLEILIRFIIHFFTLSNISQKIKKCVSDGELKNDEENNEHFDKLFAPKEKLRLDLDIQNFKNQCFSVNDFLK